MLKRISIAVLFTLLFYVPVLAQTSQEITLRSGFNFLSFTTSISLTPQQFKGLNLSIEDIYLYSAAAGSFLSLNEGTLGSLSSGKGYIVKSLSQENIAVTVSGTTVTTVDNLKLLSDFNLVGFSKAPLGSTFESLMTANTIIKGMYKWSPAAGSFISVVRDSKGTIVKLDGADPSLKAGEAYFINLYADSVLNYSESVINFTPSSYTIVPTDEVPTEALTDIPLPERTSGAGNISGTISLPSASSPYVSRAITIKSISNIKVWVKNHPEINAQTDANGSFVLKNVPKADKASGHTLEYEKVEGTDKFNGVIADIPVVENKQIDVSKYIGPLVIKKSAVIQGKIELIDGLSALGAEAYIPGISAMIAKADDDGSFSLMDVPAGTFNIVFQAFGYEITRQTVTLEANEIKQLQSVQLKKIAVVSTLGSIEGYALAADGSPVAGAVVSIISSDKTVDIGAIASATGHYKFSNIPAGKYKVIFLKDGYKGSEAEVDLVAGAALGHNRTIVKIDVTQAGAITYGLIAGSVKDSATGVPIRNAVVLTVPPTRQFYTDYNGYFDFLIQPGTYTLKIQKIGYNEEQISLAVEADKVSELNATLQSKASTAVAASVVLNASNLTIGSGDTSQLTATIKDASGNILSGKLITWASSAPLIGEVTSNGLVTAKSAGSCVITASVDGKSASISLTITGASGPQIKSIKIFPETLSLKLTENKQFVIFATYDDGSSKIIPNTMAAWSSSSECLTMLEKGTYVALTAGSAVVSAKFETFSSSSTVTVIDSSDTQPPVISHSAPAVYEAGKELVIGVSVFDNTAVAKVWLYFRTIGTTDYIKVEMPQMTAGRYSYTIPSALVTVDGINYYITAEDTKLPTPNKSTFPADGINTPAELKPVITLSSLTLSKTTDKLTLSSTYDLSPIVTIAKYSDGTGKIVDAAWSILSGGGSINGKIYTAPATGTQAVLKAAYIENGITAAANLTLSLESAPKILDSITVTSNPLSPACNVGGTAVIALAVRANYLTGTVSSNAEVTAYTTGTNWSNGLFTAASTSAGTENIVVTYSEGGVTKTAIVAVTITAAPVKVLDSITVTSNPTSPACNAGGTTSVALTVRANYLTGTVSSNAEVSTYTTGTNWSNGLFTAASTSAGTENIVVTYSEGVITKTANVAVTIAAAPVKVLDSITVTSNPTSPACNVGGTAAVSLTVRANYLTGGVSSNAEVTAYTTGTNWSNGLFTAASTSAGTENIVVTYTEGGVTKTANVAVTVTVAAPVVTTVEVAALTIEENLSTSAVVIVKDQYGAAITTGYILSYAMSNSVATVSASGVVTAGAYNSSSATGNLTVTATPTIGSAVNGTAIVTVTAETTKPVLSSVTAPNNRTMLLTYSEKVGSSALSISNYSIYNGVTGVTAPLVTDANSSTSNIIASASFVDSSQSIVKIVLGRVGSSLAGYPNGGFDSSTYRLYVSNVQDASNNIILTNSNVQFTGSLTLLQYYTYNSQWALPSAGPTGITFDNLNNFIYVTAATSHLIKKYDLNGNKILEWGGSGTGSGKFNQPYGVTTDSGGNVYVADYGNHRVQKFNSSGSWIWTIGGTASGAGDGQFNYPIDVKVFSSNLYVLDRYNNRIQKFDLAGNFVAKWGTYGTNPGQINYANAIAIDASENIYVADTLNNCIQKFTSTGTFIAKYGSSGTGNGLFTKPCGVTVDNENNIYVADSFNHRIQKLDSTGYFITRWGKNGGDGSYGSGNGEFSDVHGITRDSSGNVYVTDYNNNRVQKFSYIQ
jgi:uncharacterized protein YjiK